MLRNLLYDLRDAWRSIRRDRGFTAVALLSIGLGVGANSAIFSLVDQVLFRLLPVRAPEELVLLSWNGTWIGNSWDSGNLLSHPLFREISADNRVFDGVLARHPTQVHLSVSNTPEPVTAEIISGSYFPVLGVRPARGRLIEESDDVTPGGHPVIVVSFDYWRNRLGSSPEVIGRKVLVNNYPMTVIGVAPAGFRGMDFAEVPTIWVPTMMKRQATPGWDELMNRRARWLHVFGRLKPGITVEYAKAGLQPWFKAMLEADTRREGWPPVTEEQHKRFLASTLDVLPASHGRSDLRGRLERPLQVLMAATVLILLLACLNVANLYLARAFARRKETALEAALGAPRGRIARKLLVHSVVLALGGGLLGILIAPQVTQALIYFLPQNVALSTDINLRVLVFTLAVTLASGLLFGVAPALAASRAQPAFALKEESSTVVGRIGLRKALVVGQVALALVLLIGAGLFVRTLASLRSQGPGFQTTNLLMFNANPVKSGYTAEQSKLLMRNLLESIRTLPEVESAALSANPLLAGWSWNGLTTVESGGRRFVTETTIHRNSVSPGFFKTLGAQIISGRDFTERDAHDLRDSGFRSAIINDSFAKRYFGDRSPIGSRLGNGNDLDTRADIEIVGVVRTFHNRGLRAAEEQAYFPLFEGPTTWGSTFYVRTRTPSEAVFASIRSAVRRIDPNLPIINLRTIDDQLDQVLTTERMLATLAGAFAVLATLLAVIGLYGVMAFVVERRTREIGIRIALGASRNEAVWFVIRDAVVMVAAGVAIALPAIWWLGRLVENQLFGVQPTDSVTIGAAAALVALVALWASAIPAWRASSVNPTVALRYE